ncbi:MAG: NADH-quinone oxidoreductase subunit A, partial [Nitrospirae bacterium]|nr:NADH-quinone oxidoreductase subunit A [Nitrospirota bacterium]
MPGTYLPTEYLPVVIFILLAAAFGVVTLAVGYVIRPNKPDPSKLDPYECGVTPISDARERFSNRFYMIAMLFLLFDVEVVFLYPWAVAYRHIGIFGLVEMIIFIIILFV